MLVAHNLHVCNANIGVIEQGYFRISRAWRVSIRVDNYGRYCVPSDGVVNCFPNSFTRFLMAYEISGEVALSHPSICYMPPLCRWARAVVSNRQALDWTGSSTPTHFTSIFPRPPWVERCQSPSFAFQHLSKHPLKHVCLHSCMLVCRAVNRRTVCVVVRVELDLSQPLLFTPRDGRYYQ